MHLFYLTHRLMYCDFVFWICRRSAIFMLTVGLGVPVNVFKGAISKFPRSYLKHTTEQIQIMSCNLNCPETHTSKMTCQLVAECASHTHSAVHMMKINHQLLIRNQSIVRFTVEHCVFINSLCSLSSSSRHVDLIQCPHTASDTE